jgi:hypothetical protein
VSQTQVVAQPKSTSVKEKVKAPAYQAISESILQFTEYFESK